MTEKEFLVRPAPFNLYEIYIENGGEVPVALKAKFTSPTIAKTAIKHYLATRRDYPSRGRVKSDANIASKPRSK